MKKKHKSKEEILKIIEQEEDLTEEEIKHLENARKRMKKGIYYTEEEAKKKLKL